jgi:putative ABC transport system permease protein
MVFRIVAESFRRRPLSRLAVLGAVALGAGAASGLVMVLLGVGDRMSAELRKTGANIEILPPAGGDLAEKDIALLRETFWKKAIVRLIPELRVEKSGYTVVGREPDGAWRVEGAPGVLAGVSLGLAPGQVVDVGRPLTVTGTVSTGGPEDEELIVPLRTAQEISGRPGRISRLLVSAVVRPETEEFHAFLKGSKPFTAAQKESMLCTNFPTNVAKAFGSALDADARVIREVADTEGAILGRIEGLVWMLAGAAVLSACLSVLAALTASVVDRRKEIGLLKALGATNGSVALLFGGEALLTGILGSLFGYAVGLGAANAISLSLFGSPVAGSFGVYLATLVAAVVIVALGVAWPLRRVVGLEPHRVLHEV